MDYIKKKIVLEVWLKFLEAVYQMWWRMSEKEKKGKEKIINKESKGI